MTMIAPHFEEKLAPNFLLREVFEWPLHIINITPADRALALRLAKEHLTPEVIENARLIAKDLQEIRDWVNRQNRKYKGSIGLRPISWYRPKEWELHRRRGGGSQHVQGHAVDFMVVNVSENDYNKIMKAIFAHLQDWPGGLASLRMKGRYIFIHIDKRPARARWSY